jgi:hypothetical protein
MYFLRGKTYPFIHIMLTSLDQFGERIGCALANNDIRDSAIILRLIDIDVIPRKAEAECHDFAWPACGLPSKTCFVAEPDVDVIVHKSPRSD